MPSLKAIKKRIVSVGNTQKITRAMKLVSAAKLRRASDRAHSSRPYEEQLSSIISTTLADLDWSSDLTTERAEVRRVGIVVISTDRGLCGSLNTNVFKAVLRRIEELEGASKKPEIEIIALGKKAYDFFRKRNFKIHSNYSELIRRGSHAFMADLAEKLRHAYLEKTFDRVEVFYSRFQSALIQRPTSFVLIPFIPMKMEKSKMFLLEPSGPDLLAQLIPMLIDFQLYRCLLETIASEHGARMSAMESATKNAKEMIERLTLQRNRARQAAITKELMEIIGGAEALSA